MSLPLNKVQKRIYDNAAAATAYTVAQLAALAAEFAAVSSSITFQTPGDASNAYNYYNEIKGLVDAGYFTAAVAAYGDADVLADWVFTKDTTPPDTFPVLTIVVPFPNGCETLDGVSA